MTLHRPPVEAAFFSTDMGRYAFGLFVVFEDTNGDGYLQLPGESIIGLNKNEVLVYSETGLTTASGTDLPSGYQRTDYIGFCPEHDEDKDEAQDEDPAAELEATAEMSDGSTRPGSIEITGNIVSLFDQLPGPTCDAPDDVTPWRALCLAEGWRCTQEAFAIEDFCTFCRGDGQSLANDN